MNRTGDDPAGRGVLPSRSRRSIPVLFAVSVWIAVEGLCFVGLYALRRFAGIAYVPTATTLTLEARTNLDAFLARGAGASMDMDPALGWVPIRDTAEINSAGMRDDREYAPTPPPGVLRIAAFGDSFTYGSDVALGENWAKQITALSPSIEVLNYGVGAYGLDQAYLRYLAVGGDYHPDIVLIGYMSENLARNVNVYRGFYSRSYGDSIFTKPRFKLENGALVLVPNPLSTMDAYRSLRANETEVLREVGRHDFHYFGLYGDGALDFLPSVRLGKIAAAETRKRLQTPIYTGDGRYDERSEAYQVTLRLLDRFYAAVLARQALPIIVVFPDLNDQRRSREGLSRRYAPLLAYLEARGYRFIDAMDALEREQARYSIDDLSVKWGHYSKLGNEIVARHIRERLRAWRIDTPEQAREAGRRTTTVADGG